MIDLETGEPNICHTDNLVPCLIVNGLGRRQVHALELADGCAICSIAPTVLDLMGINIPTEMKAPSLVLNPKVLRKGANSAVRQCRETTSFTWVEREDSHTSFGFILSLVPYSSFGARYKPGRSLRESPVVFFQQIKYKIRRSREKNCPSFIFFIFRNRGSKNE